MIDILREADGILFNFLEAVYDADLFCDLDDSVIGQIRASDDPELS